MDDQEAAVAGKDWVIVGQKTRDAAIRIAASLGSLKLQAKVEIMKKYKRIINAAD